MRALVPILLATALAAGESSEPLTATLADGPVLATHFAASPLGKVWNDPVLAPLRKKVAEAMAEGAPELGTDPLALLQGLHGAQFRILPAVAGAKDLRWGGQADLGALAKVIATALAGNQEAEKLAVKGADEAWTVSDHVVARFGTVIATGGDAAYLPLPQPTVKQEGDIALRLDVAALVAAIPETKPDSAALKLALAPLAKRAGIFSFTAEIGAEGSRWSGRSTCDPAGWQAVDRSVFERLPAGTLNVASIGIDGPALWKAWSGDVLPVIDLAMHDGKAAGIAATQGEIAAHLAKAGIPLTLEQLVSGLKGTVMYASTPGVPMPGLSLAVPRSAVVDQLVGVACKAGDVEMPEEGGQAMLPLGREFPFPVMLTRDAKYWLVTTDSSLGAGWAAGTPGGFATTDLAKSLFAQAPAEACSLGATDTPAVVRMLSGVVNMILGSSRDLAPAERQAVMMGMMKLAAAVKPGVQWTVAGKDGIRVEGRGDELTSFGVPLIAAIAVPNLLESRVTANEAAAGASLKSGIFPAEIQFQGGGYQDEDGDNVGEYGLISELSGRRAAGKTPAGQLKLLMGQFAQGDTGSGYHYAIFLPDGKGGAIGEPDGDGAKARPSIVDGTTVTDANDQEKFWIAYAWPVSKDTGRRMFAILQDGQVRSMRWDGKAPVWNDAFGGGTWGDEPSWPIYRR